MIKILDNIEHSLLYNEPCRAKRMSFDHDIAVTPLDMPVESTKQSLVESKLVIMYKQWQDYGIPREYSEENAKVSIARYLYGDIHSKLLDIREDLWSEGIDEDALTELNDLIAELRGTFSKGY